MAIVSKRLSATSQVPDQTLHPFFGRPRTPRTLPLIGPDADPEGWRTYDPIVVRGVMFKTRPVQVECAVSTSVLSILTDV